VEKGKGDICRRDWICVEIYGRIRGLGCDLYILPFLQSVVVVEERELPHS